jgi:hypothetical protein
MSFATQREGNWFFTPAVCAGRPASWIGSLSADTPDSEELQQAPSTLGTLMGGEQSFNGGHSFQRNRPQSPDNGSPTAFHQCISRVASYNPLLPINI